MICERCGKEFNSIHKTARFCSHKCANEARGAAWNAKMDEDRKVVFSSGGGVQSTAIAVLIEQGRLPKPDYAIFVDTGYESASTLDYMHRIAVPRLKAVGVDMTILRAEDYCDNSVMVGGLCRIPAYKKMRDGSVQKLGTMCNQIWKVNTIRDYLKGLGVRSTTTWIGISTDEDRRARSSVYKCTEREYPLLRLGIDRDECEEIIQDAGWEMPSRTSCVCCGQRSNAQWTEMRYAAPKDFKRAIAIEHQIRAVDPSLFLHRSCKPLEELRI